MKELIETTLEEARQTLESFLRKQQQSGYFTGSLYLRRSIKSRK